MKAEAEIAQTVLSELTRAPYVITNPRPASYAKITKPQWYVTCLDGWFYEQTAHAETAWADGEGRTWIESSHLRSTTNLVEDAYGEKGAAEAMDIDYRSLSVDEVQNQLKKFPKVFDLIENWKRVLKSVSQESGVLLEMRCEGDESVAWFFFRARVGVKETSELGQGLRKTVEALKEAYDLVLKAKSN
jgi:hypothetical protein